MPTELETAKPVASAASDVSSFEDEEASAVPARRGSRRWRDNVAKVLELIRDTRPPPEQQALRLRTVERNIILPVKGLLILLVAYYVLAPVATSESGAVGGSPRGLTQVQTPGGTSPPAGTRPTDVVRAPDRAVTGNDTFNEGYRALRWMLVIYILINLPVAGVLVKPRVLRLRLRHIQNIIFFISSLDAVFVSSLTYLTDGFASIVYWLFPGLILRNSISLPLARPQLLLNLLTVVLYTSAGALDLFNNFGASESAAATFGAPDASIEGSLFYRTVARSPAEPFVLRIVLLLLLTFCCYGLQVLLEKQRQTEEDGRELATRQQQLDVAARLAAQIAHQIKNPLGIINTTIYNLDRSMRTGKKDAAEHQLEMIREEVARADQVITRLMGYAQLKEGRVEKLDVVEELERVIHEVFPPVAKYSVRLVREFAPDLPALWMQRQHLGDIFSNILLNAREALFGQGEIKIIAQRGSEDTVRVVFEDNGPGIPPDRINQIFQPYFTTKDKGSGLGLAIVKQNLNLYGGTVRVESEPGHGARFVLVFPVRAHTKLPS